MNIVSVLGVPIITLIVTDGPVEYTDAWRYCAGRYHDGDI